MVEKLMYHGGREMDLEPKNISLEETAITLFRDENPVYINLQPGDGTRYDFLLISVNSVHSLREFIGLTPDNSAFWVFLGPLNLRRDVGEGRGLFALCSDAEHMFWDLSIIYGNDWTCKVIAHFLAELWEERKRMTK